jgi:hypothetical protein
MLRCSSIGSVLGSMPGIGASVIDWIAYAHAARSEKGAKESFGKGDIRGVIASESSNNAREGGALVPTVAFGVPGTASMAILLGAFLIHGIVPGPEMLTKRLDITYTLVWSVALANLFGAGVCYLFANQLAKTALIRYGILLPTILAVSFVGAYAGSASWGDIYLVVGLGAIAWVMKRLGWPRPPVILGFVLGNLMERYMFISVERYEWSWMGRPVVLAFFALTLYGVLSPMIRDHLRNRDAGRPRRSLRTPVVDTSAIFGILMAVVFIAALISSNGWEFGARLFPQTASYAGLLCSIVFVATAVFLTPKMVAAAGNPGHGATQEFKPEQEVLLDLRSEFGDMPRREVNRRFFVYLGWLVLFIAAGHVIGLMPAMLIFLLAYMRYGGDETWRTTLMVSVPIWIMWYALFDRVIRLAWPQSLIGDWFPALRELSTMF